MQSWQRSGLHGVGSSANRSGRRVEVDEGSLYWNFCRQQPCLHLEMLVFLCSGITTWARLTAVRIGGNGHAFIRRLAGQQRLPFQILQDFYRFRKLCFGEDGAQLLVKALPDASLRRTASRLCHGSDGRRRQPSHVGLAEADVTSARPRLCAGGSLVLGDSLHLHRRVRSEAHDSKGMAEEADAALGLFQLGEFEIGRAHV